VSRLNRDEGLVIFASFLWGTSFVSAKVGVEHMDPVLFSVVRFILGSAVLLIAVTATGRFQSHIFRDPVIWGISFINAVAFELQHLGIDRTSATNAVLLVDIDVVFVAVIAAFVLSEAMTRRTAFGLALGLLGVVVVSTEGDPSSILSGSFVGNAMVFTSGLLWAFYIVYQRKVLLRETNVLMVTAAVIGLTTVFMVPMTLAFAGSLEVQPLGWASVLYTGIFCSGVAFLAYNAGLRSIGATASSLILLLEIVFAAALAFLLLGEDPSSATLIGGGMIVLAIAAISFSQA
jgi:drug/metabolite transporter (DMT)-like permease